MRNPRADEIKLLKYSVVENEGLYGLFLFLTKYENHKGVLKGTCFRWDSKEGWRKVLEGLNSNQPAEYFNLGMIGADLDFIVHQGSSYMTVLSAAKWMGRMFDRACCTEEFRKRNSESEYRNMFEERFGGQDFSQLPTGVWFFQEKEKRPVVRRKKVIY